MTARAHALLLLLVLLIVASCGVKAQTVTGTNSFGPMPSVVTGNKTEFGRFMANLQNVDKLTVAVASDGSLLATTGTKLMPTGAAVTVAGPIAKASVAAAVGRFALKGLPLLGTGVALYDLANELDFQTNNTAGAVPTVTKSDPTLCLSGTCYEYSNISVLYSPQTYNGAKTPAAACALTMATVSSLLQESGAYTLFVSGATSYAAGCIIGRNIAGTSTLYDYAGSYSIGRRTRSPDADIKLASSAQELADAVAAKSGWPSTSALARTTVAAIKAGDELEVIPNSVTGPSSSAGKVTTSTAANGNVTTNTTTNNYSYTTNNATQNTSTVTSVYNAGAGTTTTTNTDTAPIDEPQKTQCEQYPDSVGCASLDTPSGDALPKSTANVTYAAETPFASTGSCPADVTTTLHATNQTVKVWDWAKTCSYAPTIRAMVMAMAALAAFFIVMPGNVRPT